MGLRLKFGKLMTFSHKLCYVLLTLVVIIFSNITSAKIVKWVDEKGVTHYGDQLPTHYVGLSNSEISQRGILLKKNKPINTKAEQITQEKREQDKKDKALLDSYTTLQEIDLARDRNLQLDLATMQNLTQQKQTIESRGSISKKTNDNLIKQKKPLPANLSTELISYKTELAKVDGQIADRKASMDQTKKRYAAEKARFIVLKPNEVGPASSPTLPITTPAASAPVPTSKANTAN